MSNTDIGATVYFTLTLEDSRLAAQFSVNCAGTVAGEIENKLLVALPSKICSTLITKPTMFQCPAASKELVEIVFVMIPVSVVRGKPKQ